MNRKSPVTVIAAALLAAFLLVATGLAMTGHSVARIGAGASQQAPGSYYHGAKLLRSYYHG